MEESCRSTGIVVSRALARLAATAMTRSLGVANELERYLRLKKAAWDERMPVVVMVAVDVCIG